MESEKLVSLIAACALVAGGVAAIAPAVAKERPVVVTAPRADVPTRYVSYRDLDLLRPAGEKMLTRRVGTAVKQVCSELLGPLPHFYAQVGCRRDSWSRARPQIAQAIRTSRGMAARGMAAPMTIAITAF